VDHKQLIFRRLLAWLNQKFNLRRFFFFCVAGISASVAEVALFSLVAVVLKQSTWLANTISIGMAMVIGYSLNRKYTFRHRQPHPSSFFLYVLLNIWDIAFSSWLIDLLPITEPWQKTPAKVMTLLICATWNYFAYKHVIYRNYARKSATNPEAPPPEHNN
jgi:putative flippase GtrA